MGLARCQGEKAGNYGKTLILNQVIRTTRFLLRWGLFLGGYSTETRLVPNSDYRPNEKKQTQGS